MKVEVKKAEQDFKPITVNLTIENDFDLKLCRKISELNITIPNSLERELKHPSYFFLNKINNLLNNILYICIHAK